MKTIIALILVAATSVILFTGFKPGDVQTISGTVTDNQRPCGKLVTSDGNEYTIHLGPYWYWEENKYVLNLSTAQIKGDVKGNDIYPYEIVQDGNTMVFTDDKGVPKWNKDGKGRGYGKGNGKGYGKGDGRGNCPRNK
ncbi:MAG: hypothetical protein K8I03_08060 [Ignavibacteria bacterium]|nr:hypothetical protein [Ignavibacteria bacterium]